MKNPKTSFLPNADGIFNMDQRDHDDVTYIHRLYLAAGMARIETHCRA
jgi:hypothetical protein